MDIQNVNLQTALHLAVERQHTQIVRVCTEEFLCLHLILPADLPQFALPPFPSCWCERDAT